MVRLAEHSSGREPAAAAVEAQKPHHQRRDEHHQACFAHRVGRQRGRALPDQRKPVVLVAQPVRHECQCLRPKFRHRMGCLLPAYNLATSGATTESGMTLRCAHFETGSLGRSRRLQGAWGHPGKKGGQSLAKYWKTRQSLWIINPWTVGWTHPARTVRDCASRVL